MNENKASTTNYVEAVLSQHSKRWLTLPREAQNMVDWLKTPIEMELNYNRPYDSVELCEIICMNPYYKAFVNYNTPFMHKFNNYEADECFRAIERT